MRLLVTAVLLAFAALAMPRVAAAELSPCLIEEHFRDAYSKFRMRNVCGNSIEVTYEMVSKKEGRTSKTRRLSCGESWLDFYFIDTEYNVLSVTTFPDGKTCKPPNLIKPTPPKSQKLEASPPKAAAPKRAESAPSWCSGKLSGVETMICSNERLSRDDNELNKKYAQISERMSDEAKNSFKLEQRAWRAQRDKCQTVICLQDLYTKRIEALYKQEQEMDNSFASTPPEPNPTFTPQSQFDPDQDSYSAPVATGGPECAEPDNYQQCLSDNPNKHFCWTQNCCYPRFSSVTQGGPAYNQCEAEFETAQ